ncbi:MAG: DUF2892 domain-containing protein [Verrucomicrobiae bacterium]|nr:DUF2892 domain-containing protein [Verrucomicrobiae bacterium]
MRGSFFAPNIGKTGRWLRGISGLLCGGGGVYVALARGRGWGWLLVAAGAFMIYEALRGWCVARACGLKTRW